MDLEAMMTELLDRQKKLEATIDELKSKQEITEVLYRCARGSDRGDPDLRGDSCFHPDATDYRGVASGHYKKAASVSRQWKVAMAMHPITNIQIRLDGDVARVESYVLPIHHINEADGSGRDEFLRARYLDRFERREGVWKIARRITVWEWSRIEPSKESWFDSDLPGDHEKHFIFGRRDKQDLSYTFELPEELRHIEPDGRF